MFETLFPILFLVGVAAFIAVVMAGASILFGRRTSEGYKYEPYESGIIPKGDTKERFPVKFFLIAVMFILFDIEVVFLYPWAVIYQKLGLFGFVEILVFITILLVGYFYILGKGALKWE
ncbi:MAG: NADH-quinone oxidoreductase subunit A [candidate division Zixibacteria bacterium HGW-Zixibacteria-1]|nr:MAG: NADH-quinone oxidoreductase subunit A [candidate division Zixibacteria bacterium HGW-Zixibacteria-1]